MSKIQAHAPKDVPKLPWLLSEFKGAWAHRFFIRPQWGRVLAIALSVCAIGILILGHYANANAMRLTIEATISSDTGASVSERVYQDFGYLIEATHGLYYLVIAPIFVLLAARFIRFASEGLTSLQSKGRFIEMGNNSTHQLWALNRRVVRPLLLTVVPLSALIGIGLEVSRLQKNNTGERNDLGYMQAPYFDGWIEQFNDDKTSREKKLDTLFKLKSGSALALAFEARMKDVQSSQWTNITEKHGDAVNRLRAAVAGDGTPVSLRADRHLPLYVRPAKWNSRPFLLFFIGVLLVEGCFHAFVAWMAIKVLLWLYVLYDALPGSRRRHGRLIPDCKDDSKYFGLASLNSGYNALVAMVLIGVTTGVLNFKSNSEKGTIVGPGQGVAFAGQGLIWVVALVTFVALVCGPLWFFGHKMKSERARSLRELEAKAESLRSNITPKSKDAVAAELRAIENDFTLVEGQVTWPKHNRMFIILLSLTTGAFLVPVVLWFALPEKGDVAKQAEAYVVLKRIATKLAVLSGELPKD